MKHRAFATTPKKNLVIHSDRYLYILAWLNDPIIVGPGSIDAVGASGWDWGCLVGLLLILLIKRRYTTL